MENDEAVYYMGEDVRASIYGASKDLFNKFGSFFFSHHPDTDALNKYKVHCMDTRE